MLSIMTFGFLTYIIVANLKSVTGKYVITLFMGIVIVSIGLSRVILNVHYPTDILAGYCVGGILLIMAIYCHRLLPRDWDLIKRDKNVWKNYHYSVSRRFCLHEDVIHYK